ncbi:MAG: GNAT family N-acetyltransferase [Candidatus Limnocylindria bacterium]
MVRGPGAGVERVGVGETARRDRLERDLAIRPLTPARLPDLAVLFAQRGDAKSCWCAFYRVRGMLWTNSTPESNRGVLEKAVRTAAREHRAPGLVAYRDKEVVGWVSLGPREDYDRLEHSKVYARVDDAPVWSIVCFVVGRRVRGRGVASALLDAAIAYAREHGAAALEAYPAETDGERVPAASAYHGTLSMFERAGFEVVAKRQFNRTTPVRLIARRTLV